MRSFARAFVYWIPLAVAIVGISVLVYAAVQQNYRQSLNDPQIQLAEDAAHYLETNASPDLSQVLTFNNGTIQAVDMASSLTPWVALVGADGTVIQTDTSGFLDTKVPVFPIGILQAAARGQGKDTDQLYESRVTWQPQTGVRQAVVVVAVTNGQYKGDFVVAGRNMREVESRESSLGNFVFSAMLALLLATFALEWCSLAILKRFA